MTSLTGNKDRSGTRSRKYGVRFIIIFVLWIGLCTFLLINYLQVWKNSNKLIVMSNSMCKLSNHFAHLFLTFIMYVIQILFQSLLFILLSFLADDRFIPYQISIILSWNLVPKGLWGVPERQPSGPWRCRLHARVLWNPFPRIRNIIPGLFLRLTCYGFSWNQYRFAWFLRRISRVRHWFSSLR